MTGITPQQVMLGIPPSPTHTPDPVEIARLLTAMKAADEANTAVSNELKAAFSAGKIPFDTKDAMDADLAYAAGVRAEVDGDTAANNGVYRKSGVSGEGAWVKVAPSTQDLIDAAVSAESLFTAGLDPEYAMRIDDAAGNLIGGIKWDDSATETNIDLVAFTSNDAAADVLYYNNDDVFDDELTPTQATRNAAIGDRYDPLPSQGGDVVAVRHAAGSARPPTREEFATEGNLWPFASSVSKIALLLVVGQSTGVGIVGGPTASTDAEALTSSPVEAGRVAMFGNGIRHLGTTHSSQWLDYPFRLKSQDGRPGLVDCVEFKNTGAGETGYAVAARRWREDLGSQFGVVVATTAIGSSQSTQIAKGTTPYLNALRIAQEVRRLAEINQCEFRVLQVVLDDGQSEASANMSASDWATFITTLQADLQTDLREVTGSTLNIPMLVHQNVTHPENSGGFGRTLVETPQGALDAAASNSLVRVLPPSSIFALNDGVHHTSAAYRDRGDIVGEALAEGHLWVELAASAATRTGTTVTINYAGLSGTLVVDTAMFPDDGQKGFHFYDSGGNEISATVTVGSNTVTMALNSTPANTNNSIYIGLQGALYTGGSQTTAGSPVRDSASLGNNTAGTPMFKPVSAQKISCN